MRLTNYTRDLSERTSHSPTPTLIPLRRVMLPREISPHSISLHLNHLLICISTSHLTIALLLRFNPGIIRFEIICNDKSIYSVQVKFSHSRLGSNARIISNTCESNARFVCILVTTLVVSGNLFHLVVPSVLYLPYYICWHPGL